MIYPVIVSLIVAIGGFLLGFDGVVNSGAIPFYKHTFDIAESPFLIGISSSMIILGGFIGNLAAGYISDKYGRKPSLLLTSVLFTIGALGTAMAFNIYIFIFCKLIAGLGVGIAILVAPMYITEIAPPKKRGWLVTFNQLNIVLGLSIAYFSNYYILQYVEDPNLNWRWMLGIGALPAVIYTLLLFVIPESPRWLIQKNKVEEAQKTLVKIGGEEYAENEIIQIKKGLQTTSNAKKETPKQLRNKLFSKQLRLVLTIGFGLAIFQQVSGINAILYYAPMIFEMTGEGQNSAFIQSMIIGCVFVVVTVLSMFLIDKLGRRPMLIIGSSIMSISLFVSAYFFAEATYTIEKESIATVVSGLRHQIVLDKAKLQDPSFENFDTYHLEEEVLFLSKNGIVVKRIEKELDLVLGKLLQVAILEASLFKIEGVTFSSELNFFSEIKNVMGTVLFQEFSDNVPSSLSAPFFSAAKSGLLMGGDYKVVFEKAINKVFIRDYQGVILNNSIQINALWVLLGILGFITGFSLSVGPVLWAMLPEILPNKLRGVGISIIGGVNSATSFFVATLFPLELEYLGAAATFSIFGLCMLGCLVFSITVVKETKGKSLEEIEKELIGKSMSTSSDIIEPISPLAH